MATAPGGTVLGPPGVEFGHCPVGASAIYLALPVVSAAQGASSD